MSELSVQIVGSLSGWVGVRDFALKVFAEAQLVTRADLTLQDAPSGGPCTIDLRNAIGGGGDGFTVTFADGEVEASATGSLSIAAGGTLYARVTAVSGFPQNLAGNIEAAPALAASAGGMIVSLARVKDEAGISQSTHDTRLTNMIVSVGTQFERFCQRPLMEATVADEKHDGLGWSDSLVLKNPAESITSVDESSVSLASGTDFEHDAGSCLVRRIGRSWASGQRNLVATYVSGFDPVPEDIAEAAIDQVRHIFNQSHSAKGDRLGFRGKPLDSGGDPQYVAYKLLPSVREVLTPYRRRF